MSIGVPYCVPRKKGSETSKQAKQLLNTRTINGPKCLSRYMHKAFALPIAIAFGCQCPLCRRAYVRMASTSKRAGRHGLTPSNLMQKPPI